MSAIHQGEIYLADLNPVYGHEQGGFRPVLVLQNETLNKNLHTVIVAPITSNLKAKGFLTIYFLAKKISGLPHDSLALLFQLRTIDKRRLKRKVGMLSSDMIRAAKRQTLFLF